jgi:hypothetical protein
MIVMMILSQKPEAFSEFLGMKERVDEVEAEQQRDREADGGFDHDAIPSKLGAEACIGRGEREEQEARTDEDEIQHAPCSVVRLRVDVPTAGSDSRD